MVAKRAKKNYHHGDLPRAIETAALTLINRRGTPDFTLRELALRIGVAHAAVYAHFANKSALLEHLAVRGLQSLNGSQQAALDGDRQDPLDALRSIAHAYVAFACREPGAYRLIFNTDLARLDAAPVQAARASAAGLMLDLIRAGQSRDYFVAAKTDVIAVALWGAVHGLSHLLISGHLEEMPVAAGDITATIEVAVNAALRGVLNERGLAAFETLCADAPDSPARGYIQFRSGTPTPQ